MKKQIAGRVADAFIGSKLTPLLLAAAIGLGIYTTATLPSEEEPQIMVPLADIYLPMPGAEPMEVENRALIPLEEILSGIDGVEYVYSHAGPGFGLVTVRYEVGRDLEDSLVRLYAALLKHSDLMPPGLAFPLVKTVSIDDVPFFTVALAGKRSHAELRRVAEEVATRLEAVEDVRDVTVIGGSPREIRVELSAERLAQLGIDPGLAVERLRASNVSLETGRFTSGDRVVRVVGGSFLASAEDVSAVVLTVRDGQLVQVGDVAEVHDGPAEVDSYTFHGHPGEALEAMVTIAVSKRPGADATAVGHRLEHALESMRGRVVPVDIATPVTRNYGETAREKVTTLKEHLGLAVVAVGIVVTLFMGWRSAAVVMLAVPITFALTLFVYQVFGYTLNRITLFALIFVTGIRRSPAHALRFWPHGSIHEPDAYRGQPGDDLLPADGSGRHSLAGLSTAGPKPCRKSLRAGGDEDLPGLPASDGTAAEPAAASGGCPGRSARTAVGRHGPVLYSGGGGEDASVRRQERAAGDHRHAGGHLPGTDHGAGRRRGLGPGARAGDLERTGVRGNRRPLQLQRHDPTLLSA
jgi:hypothetical protein